MKVDQTKPHRIRIEGKDGQAFDVVEQLGGGFCITGVTDLGCTISLTPIASNVILLQVKR